MKKEKRYEFEWDKGNEQKNWIRHKVSKREQAEIFYDPNSKRDDDVKHSSEIEKRYLIFGKTQKGRKLVISFTIREGKIRTIMARPMNRKEVPIYEETVKVA